MSEDLSVRLHNGSLALFREGKMIIFGLEREVAKGFRFDDDSNVTTAVAFRPDAIATVKLDKTSETESAKIISYAKSKAKKDVYHRPGRQLILKNHVDFIRSLLREDASITVKGISRKLRSKGVSFASDTAIINLAKRYDLRIAGLELTPAHKAYMAG